MPIKSARSLLCPGDMLQSEGFREDIGLAARRLTPAGYQIDIKSAGGGGGPGTSL